MPSPRAPPRPTEPDAVGRAPNSEFPQASQRTPEPEHRCRGPDRPARGSEAGGTRSSVWSAPTPNLTAFPRFHLPLLPLFLFSTQSGLMHINPQVSVQTSTIHFADRTTESAWFFFIDLGSFIRSSRPSFIHWFNNALLSVSDGAGTVLVKLLISTHPFSA